MAVLSVLAKTTEEIKIVSYKTPPRVVLPADKQLPVTTTGGTRSHGHA